MTSDTRVRRRRSRPGRRAGSGAPLRLSATLISTLTIQGATVVLAIDMYTPAFPQVGAELRASGSLVGLTLTMFSIGFGLGNFLGGPISDQRGRRTPLLLGSALCLIAAVGCALSPSIGVLIACRVAQGLGGGVAAVVGRAIIVDLASGARLARVMSILTGFSGLAPVVAPVLGASMLSAGGTWRTVFWFLVGFGVLTFTLAVLFVPESLPPERRRPPGLSQFTRGIVAVLRIPEFVGFLLVTTFAGAMLFAYVSTSAFVLELINGMTPAAFAAFFASNALLQVVLSFGNAAIVGRVRPQVMIAIGLGISASGVAVLAVAVFLLSTPVVLICAGFVLMMSGLPFISSNSNALASSSAAHVAGSASALLGMSFSLAASLSAPIATAGAGRTAVPMVSVMIVSIVGAAVALALVSRRIRHTAEPKIR